jgi:hypothetical protein
MEMRVVEARNHDVSSEVDPSGLGAGRRGDFVRRSDCSNTLSLDCDCLGVFAGWIGCEYLPVQKDEVGRLR